MAIEERASGRPRLRCWDPATAKHVYVPLAFDLRDSHGSLDVALVRAARQAALELLATREAGWPAVLPGRAPLPPVPEPSVPGSPTRGPLLAASSARDECTLEGLFVDYLAVPTGRFVEVDRTHGEAVSKAIDIVKSLGPGAGVRNLKSGVYRELWRALAERYKQKETREIQVGRKRSESTTSDSKRAARTIRWGGPRHAEQCVTLLLDAVRLGAERGFVAHAPALPARWHQDFCRDWEKITGERLSKPVETEGPRYTLEQLQALYKHLEQADPRLHLAIELAFEARLGQVKDAWRSDLDLDKDPFGSLTIPGSGKKLGTEILFTRNQRRLVDRMMRVGYLQPLEAAHRDGRITNYPLYPGGKIGYGLDPLRAKKPLTRSGLASMFRRLERLAGVAHEVGRLWYGFRRTASDLAEDSTVNDPLVSASLHSVSASSVVGPHDQALNSITGHADSRSRRGYQKKQAPRVLRQAQLIRDGVRRQLRGEDGEDPKRTDLVQE